MVRGSPEFIDQLRNQPNEWVLWFRVTFQTHKTTKLGSYAVLARPAVMGRRSEIESEALDLLLNFLRWRGRVPPKTPLLSRPPTKGKNGIWGKWKTVGAAALVRWVKAMATRHGVRDSHVSAISFRKGHVTTVMLLTVKERENSEKGLESAINRAGKWAKGSRVPQKHYQAHWDDRGPLALISSWEDGVQIGGGFQGWKIRQPAK